MLILSARCFACHASLLLRHCGRLLAVSAVALAGVLTAAGSGLAAPTAAGSTTATSSNARLEREVERYRLGPGDRLEMSVFKVEGYEASVEVLSDGTINLPRIGTVEVWGLTLEQARQRITGRPTNNFCGAPWSISICGNRGLCR